MPTEVSVPGLSLKPQMVKASSTKAVHENEWYRNFNPSYTITEQPLHTMRPIKILIIGAGASGLNIAFKTQRQFPDSAGVTFSIYEKNQDVGGTWLENRYPGCTCDIPSHAYQWSFKRSSKWSAYYSGSEEIWKYLKDWAVENELERYVRFGHRVDKAVWDESKSIWRVHGTNSEGEEWEDTGDILASCHGVLK